MPLTSACSHGDQNERVRPPASKARHKSRPQAQGRRARAEQEREERGVRLCICHVGSRSVRVQEGCCAPTPHPSRAEEAGVLNRRLTQVCGARARKKGAQGQGGRVPPPQLGMRGRRWRAAGRGCDAQRRVTAAAHERGAVHAICKADSCSRGSCSLRGDTLANDAGRC